MRSAHILPLNYRVRGFLHHHQRKIALALTGICVIGFLPLLQEVVEASGEHPARCALLIGTAMMVFAVTFLAWAIDFRSN